MLISAFGRPAAGHAAAFVSEPFTHDELLDALWPFLFPPTATATCVPALGVQRHCLTPAVNPLLAYYPE